MKVNKLEKYGENHKTIIEACKKGDERQKYKLYQLYSKAMFNVCYRMMNNREEAEDMLQEGFIKVFRSIRSFEFQGSLKGWVRKIITNTAIDHWRRTVKEYSLLSLDNISSTDQPVEPAHSSADYSEIIDQVNKLPSGARVIFNLYALEGYSHKEIAAKLNISEGTSKSQVNRARQLLQQHLAGFFRSDG